MKVCVLMPVLDPYKGGNHLPLLAALSDTSFIILCNRSKVPEADLPSNVEVVTVPGRTGSYYYGFSDYRFASLVHAFAAPDSDFWKQFDVIHINQTMGPALCKLKKSGVPIVFAIHHPVTADLAVATAESGMFRALQWRLKYALLKRWQRNLCRHATKIMTVSQTMRQRIAQDYGVDPQAIAVVPNGVDGSVFTPGSELPTTDVVAIGSFVHPRKGFRYLATVYRALAAKGYSIADVGRRSDEQVRILSAIPGVTMHGTVPEDQLISILRHAKVLISTSLFEGFGLSLIEALACGHPGFAFAVGAVPEVLLPIDSWLVTPPRDTDTLIARIDEYLSLSPNEQQKMGSEYREKVLSLYPLTKSSEALSRLYREFA